MIFKTWISFLLFSIITSISPGPGNILTINHALRYGWRKTLSLIIGQEIALVLIILAISEGAELLLSSSSILIFIKIFGIIWLMYTSFQMWCASINKKDSTYICETISKKKSFIRGFFTTITNIKAITCLISTLPACLTPIYPIVPQIIIMSLTMTIIDSSVMLLFAITSSYLRPFFQKSKNIKIQNRISSIFFLFIAISICFL
ncbi:LysE family translocator [Candidatus Profftella armatura]|uniref:Neutral amino-acid efflux system efflux protein, homoserine/homoserine lactone efflux protein n=1 Tax=Candidatus Profftella armatura TaxID=669502 RepID=S5R3S5_9PROT|nr:LysE family translocator [Candidatus Profftella armatura]AGS06844.1 neutral amino-acid efflux system efflux protein, homoserine/homoserine lactone efflux protein [Candidatus Profftella armatura]QLK13755.1 LysE family translocator [Candidatus Profftella armatura]